MAFVDGFIAAVPNDKREDFISHARKFGEIIRDFGALKVVDCLAADIPDGKVTSFPLAVQCKEDEIISFSWVIWPDKATRDAAWEKMQNDPRFDPSENPMPFDGKRLIYGGFDMVCEC